MGFFSKLFGAKKPEVAEFRGVSAIQSDEDQSATRRRMEDEVQASKTRRDVPAETPKAE